MAFSTTTVLSKKVWDVWVYCSAVNEYKSSPGVNVGQLDGDASLKVSPGDTLKLASGIEATISENGEATFTIVGHGATAADFKNNYDSLKGLINKSCNVAFVPAGTSFGTENVKLSNVYLFPELNIQANQVNKITVTAKREAGVGTAVEINATNNS
jgi:hypothetical protein